MLPSRSWRACKNTDQLLNSFTEKLSSNGFQPMKAVIHAWGLGGVISKETHREPKPVVVTRGKRPSPGTPSRSRAPMVSMSLLSAVGIRAI
jgi:hypothetical protein